MSFKKMMMIATGLVAGTLILNDASIKAGEEERKKRVREMSDEAKKAELEINEIAKAETETEVDSQCCL